MTQITEMSIKELVESGILSEKKIPMPGTPERNDFEQLVFSTKAYKSYFNKLTKSELKGTEKQVSWATEIRNKKAQSVAFEMVVNSIYFNDGNKAGVDFNKYASKKIAEFSISNAALWIGLA